MIDRTFLPRVKPMTEWPDEETATPRELCAPLSATLQSPRGNVHEGKGLAFSLSVKREREKRRIAARKKPPRGGKWE